MKKTYLQPEIGCLEIRDDLLLLEESVTMPIHNGGTTGQIDEDDDVDDPDELLAKPTTIYVAWDDDDLEI